MKKRLNSFLYIKGRYIHNEHKIIDENGEYLYAKGEYPTKIRKEDLTEDYIEFSSGTIGYRTGYLKTSGIKDMKYVPRRNNHLFKDDYLFISYHEELTQDPFDYKFEGFPEYDIHVCGSDIIKILLAAEKYSGFDISEIKNQINEKKNWFRVNYPEDYERSFGKRDVNFFKIYK